MKTIIAGSRDLKWADVRAAISACPWWMEITEVVSGRAPGVDRLGEAWAKQNGIPVIPFPADWTRYGKAAGPIRNSQMAQNAEALLAVWDGVSDGTADMIEKADARNLRVFVWNKQDHPTRGDAV